MTERENFSPAYVALYPMLTEIAREHGYALAVHGSVKRDFDLVAVPWEGIPTHPEVLFDSMRKAIAKHWDVAAQGPELKPHNRFAWSLTLGSGSYLDISIMFPPHVRVDQIDFSFKELGK